MNVLEARFRIVTPMFLGGAKPNETAELRPPSIKGILRFWYRAVDPCYRGHEARLFGGTGPGQGQSSFNLNVSGPNPQNNQWEDNQQDLRYFAFPFKMRPNDRRYINPDQEITLTLAFKRAPDERDRRSILAALWLMGHVGGAGARCRRGFGTVALCKWDIAEGRDWPELEDLPIAHGRIECSTWMDTFTCGMRTLRQWFTGTPCPDHLVIDTNTTFRLDEQPYQDWASALASAADNMRGFRRRKNPDYTNVKAHICQHDTNARAVGVPLGVTPAHLTTAPERSAFGLPLPFRYTSLRYAKTDRHGNVVTNRNGDPITITPSTTFEGRAQGKTRSASRIMIRVVKIDESFHVLYCRFNGPLLNHGGQPIKDEWDQYPSPSDTILDDYWQQLPTGVDLTWHN